MPQPAGDRGFVNNPIRLNSKPGTHRNGRHSPTARIKPFNSATIPAVQRLRKPSNDSEKPILANVLRRLGVWVSVVDTPDDSYGFSGTTISTGLLVSQLVEGSFSRSIVVSAACAAARFRNCVGFIVQSVFEVSRRTQEAKGVHSM